MSGSAIKSLFGICTVATQFGNDEEVAWYKFQQAFLTSLLETFDDSQVSTLQYLSDEKLDRHSKFDEPSIIQTVRLTVLLKYFDSKGMFY